MQSMNQDEYKKKLILSKQMRNLEKQESKILNQRENAFLKTKVTPVMNKIQEKIPDKLKTLLDAAFYKGFQLVFEKGNVYIEKTYDKNKLQLEHDLNNYAVDRYPSNKYMKKLDSNSNLSTTINSSIAILEGGVLGALGIGLPDIPLIIAVVIRTINEIALSYGYQYDTNEEKIYQLNLICGAMAKAEKQREFDNYADRLGETIDNNIVTELNLHDKMRETAELLSDALLTSKFIQGIPIVGVIGGIVNHTIVNKIGRYARVKYKKRYLLKKMNSFN